MSTFFVPPAEKPSAKHKKRNKDDNHEDCKDSTTPVLPPPSVSAITDPSSKFAEIDNLGGWVLQKGNYSIIVTTNV